MSKSPIGKYLIFNCENQHSVGLLLKKIKRMPTAIPNRGYRGVWTALDWLVTGPQINVPPVLADSWHESVILMKIKNNRFNRVSASSKRWNGFVWTVKVGLIVRFKIMWLEEA